MKGLSLSWELAVATIYLGPLFELERSRTVVWSPCSKFIAASTRESVEVLDAATLNRLATFNFPPLYCHFNFSPDSRSLTLFTHSKLISWDIQTGCCLNEIEILPKPGGRFPCAVPHTHTYSNDGKMVAVACEHNGFEVHTFDLPSSTWLGPLFLPDGRLMTPIVEFREIYSNSIFPNLAFWHPIFPFLVSFVRPVLDE